MQSKPSKLSTKILLMMAVIVLLSNSILCVVSVINTRKGIKKSIRQRMLDIANCASGSVNGDILKTLRAEDAGTEKYKTVYNALAIFRDNVEVKYVYGIKDEGGGRFTFTVDPTVADPATFGEKVVFTEALALAARGTAAVDEVPYSDAWGEFYSAYSPVFDSSGKVAGIIGADFSTSWFEAQLSERTQATVISYLVILLFTLALAAVLSLLSVAPFVRRQEQLVVEVEKKAGENEHLSLQVAQSLAAAIDAKDAYTKGHSSRVAEYAQEIARRYGYRGKALEKIYMAALLHDVGKIGVPDGIINKPSGLSEEEFEIIKKHPVMGDHILKNIDSMPELLASARWHHERFDGGGYPDGLDHEKIPETARIIAVADAYDAMTSNRSYRQAMPQAKIREQIRKGRGTQFDPVFADIMLAMIDEDSKYTMQEIPGQS